jgi:hypothetical protein
MIGEMDNRWEAGGYRMVNRLANAPGWSLFSAFTRW